MPCNRNTMPTGMTKTMTSSNRRRQRPYRRQRNPPRIQVGDNDRRIVRYVHDYRMLSQKQLERLLDRSRSTVQRLLRRLYDHRFLDRVFVPVNTLGSSPSLYVLDREGVMLLRQMGIEVSAAPGTRDLSGLFLEHTTALNDVRIAVEQGSAQQGWKVECWLSERNLKAAYDRVVVRGHKQRVAVVPDGYFRLYIPDRGTSHFFLELDRGTMTLDRFQDKIRAYVSYYKSGQYTQRYQSRGFRMMTIVAGVGRGRLTNLLQSAAQIQGIGRRFWFIHLDDVEPQTVLTSPVWQVAGDITVQPLFEPAT